MAHNEGRNIKALLETLLNQRTQRVFIKEIVVVASGCTDDTIEVARKFEGRTPPVRVLPQPQRMGKASAINYFLQNSSADIYVIESGDTIPEKDTIENLLEPFADPLVGMTGAHTIPQGGQATFVEFSARFLWNMHHAFSLKYPKLGELVAFRNNILEIPPNTSVDEAAIEALVTRKGYLLKYAPDAIVYNHPPKDIRAFFNQRHRIFIGHLYLKKAFGYEVATMNPWRVLCVIVKHIEPKPAYIMRAIAVASIECISRLLALIKVCLKSGDPYIWKR